jgi:16S rRNA processing protein RimM
VKLGETELAWPEDAIQVAYVLGAWGVQGWIKIQALASDPQALFSSRRWFLNHSENNSSSVVPAKGLPKPALPVTVRKTVGPVVAGVTLPCLVRVAEVKHHSTVIVAKLQDMDGRTQAEQLKGLGIFVSRASFPTPNSDEFYWIDLLGLSVLNRSGESLGVVVGLLDNGPHQVLRTQIESERDERLIPFVSAYIDKVDLAQKLITVDWGLDY